MVSSLNRKAFSIFDGILIACLLGFSLSGITFMHKLSPADNSVIIEVDGRLYGVYQLSEDRILSVEGPLGRTVIEIKEKKVRVLSSPCTNKFCVHQGFLNQGSIICIPNRVVIIIGASPVDAITG
ncbi:MAG: NusG domain II-containing protein [Thermodesulfovibrionales bacterium]|nr:NusG domain II-containing protein [Thermodesulfovibrionales bacterium]